MLETIRESKSFKAPLPPRAAKIAITAKAGPSTQPTRYDGDQDPTDDKDGLEYAKAYHSLQLKALKADQKQSGKVAEGSPNSSTSDQSFVCNMSAASEPLYGDPGEEDFWR